MTGAQPDGQVSAYRLFPVEVLRTSTVTPHMRRITLGSPDLGGCVSGGLDQRIKVFFPPAGADEPDVPEGEDWYERFRAMPEDVRPAMRTFTVRYFRPAANELDVDFVLHDGHVEAGPAARWAAEADVGDRVAILAPDLRHEPILGVEFRPPDGTDWCLIAGDETALPAIGAIVESLPDGADAEVYVEIPTRADVQELSSAGRPRVTWLPRDEDGPRLAEAVKQVRPRDGRRYAWLAGEATAITDLRRFLVEERGYDKQSVYFSGYWMRGISLE